MDDKFAGGEILDIGIQIEKNGKEFYEAFAAKTQNDGVKRIFKYLANEEEKHIAAFEHLRKEREGDSMDVNFPDEYAAYMSALAKDHVFPSREKAQELMNSMTTDIQAVETAIQFEKDSIVVFGGMKKIVRPKDVDVLEELIHQENIHLEQLFDLKKKIGK
ncbi:MAG: ferritin family protein [Candidatus Omnitrophota bacterium]